MAFLDMLLEASENGDKLTDEEIREEVDTFMFEEKVYKELESIFKDSDRSPTMNDLHAMKYLEMVIKEALRLYPSVPCIMRTATEDVEIGGYMIPAGVTIHYPIFWLHLNPDYFPNPREFNPDNFLPEKMVNRHPYAYLPFSAGPRNCIGQKFAMLELKIVLSNVLRHYEVRSVEKEKDIVKMVEFIFTSKNGFRVTIAKRKRK